MRRARRTTGLRADQLCAAYVVYLISVCVILRRFLGAPADGAELLRLHSETNSSAPSASLKMEQSLYLSQDGFKLGSERHPIVHLSCP